MDLLFGTQKTAPFVTNVGIITSYGPHGHDLMAAEWTHQISHKPGLIAICLAPDKATVDNIRATKEFGVNLCAENQATLSSVAGGYSGRDYDKIHALKELGFSFYSASKISALMVKGASLNIECKLFKELKLGSHLTFVGEAVEGKSLNKEPLVYHEGKYWNLTNPIKTPPKKELERIRKIVFKYKKE